MSMFPTSVRSRLAFGFGLLSAINLILGAADYHTLAGLNRASSELEFANRERNLTGQLFQAAAKEGLSVRGFLLTGDPKMLEAYENGKQEYGSTLAQLLEIAKTDRVRYLLGEVRRLHENYGEFSDREIRLSRGKQSQRASEMMHTQAMPTFQALEMSIRAVLSDLDQQRSNLTAQQDREVKVGELITIMLCIPGTLLGLVMGSAIGRSVATSVNKMIALIQELAANNLAAEDLRMSGKDEVGQAGIALDHMKNSLAEMIRSIAGTAEHVASASEEISSAASQQVSSVGHQKDQTAQVASALQQMSATVQQVSENSGRAADASHKAADTARQGGLIVEQTLLKMQLIAESVEGTAHKVEELGKRSVQIGRIVGVINDIADQTNLLALNAAIEAARAGEQGRGFAVVADEVRKLAERTTTATKEIAAMIESVQNETQLAVQAMQDGTQQVEEGVSTTQKAGEALKEIIQMSQTVGDMVTHIATAATQQSRATDDITNSMNQIAQLLLESADGAKQSEKACQDLSRLALDLRRLVENFRLPAETVSDSTSGFGRQAASYQRQYPSQLEIHGSGKSFAAGAR